MIYLISCLILVLISTLIMKKLHVERMYSKVIGIIILLCLLANISLVENIAANVTPEKNDGYSISRGIATWILGDDGGVLSDFKNAYHTSVYFTIFFIILFVLVISFESRKRV